MSQPSWKFAGHIGDIDPIAHGGGYVYTDETGVYPPELTWFEPAPDDVWDKLGDQTPLKVYRLIIERAPENEWWYKKLSDVAGSCGQDLEELQRMATSAELMERAYLYGELLACFGPFEFDQYPSEMTEAEAYKQYAAEMVESRRQS